MNKMNYHLIRLEYEYCQWLYRREDDAIQMDLFEQQLLYYKLLFSLMSEEEKEPLEYMKEMEQEMIAMEEETLKMTDKIEEEVMKECFDQCKQTEIQDKEEKDEREDDFVYDKTLIEQEDKRGDLDYAVPPTDASIVGDRVNLANADIDDDNEIIIVKNYNTQLILMN